MSDERISMSRIAAEAGVHQTTVSRALRGDPRISEAVRHRIVAIADELGYRPDPVLSRLCDYRSALRRRDGMRRAVLAFLTDYPLDDPFRDIDRGFSEQADRLGYRVTQMRGVSASDPETVAHRYRGQGCDGLFVLSDRPAPDPDVWRGLRAIWYGSEAPAGLPAVYADEIEASRMAFAKAWSAGYRRIGAVFFVGPIAERGVGPAGGFLYSRHTAPEGAVRIPPLLFHGNDKDLKGRFRRWLDRWQPDVLIGHNALFLWLARQSGRRIPEDMGYIDLMTAACNPDVSGTDYRYRDIGHQAADLLDLLYRAHAVLPMREAPRITLRPRWIDGRTLPSREKSG